jgi:hypothetical protein
MDEGKADYIGELGRFGERSGRLKSCARNAIIVRNKEMDVKKKLLMKRKWNAGVWVYSVLGCLIGLGERSRRERFLQPSREMR